MEWMEWSSVVKSCSFYNGIYYQRYLETKYVQVCQVGTPRTYKEVFNCKLFLVFPYCCKIF